jgi:hypothetical protein
MASTKHLFSFHRNILSLFLIAAASNVAVQGTFPIPTAYALLLLSVATYALHKKNVFLIAALLIASASYEVGWLLQGITQFFSYAPVRGLPLFQLQPTHPFIDLAVNSYHLFLLPLLLHAVYKTRHVLANRIKIAWH